MLDPTSLLDPQVRLAHWVRLARQSSAAFCAFVLTDGAGRLLKPMAPMHYEWHKLASVCKRLILWGSVENAKAIPLDTPIPTPTGYRPMGDLIPGDHVYGSDGNPCRVVTATPPLLGRPLYRVYFDDGDSVLADADHQWIIEAEADMRLDPPSQDHVGSLEGAPLCACGCGLRTALTHPGSRDFNRYVKNHHGRLARRQGRRVMTTREMLEAGVTRSTCARKKDGERYLAYRWRVPLCRPVQYPPADLPVPPYVLGAWLGDGTSVAPDITAHEDDRFIIDKCLALTRCPSGKERRQGREGRVLTVNVGLGSLRGQLRRLGLLGNKHIPEVYLTSSVEQRRELLAGLLDTDGTISQAGSVTFSVTSRVLAEGVLELTRSLGLKASWRETRASLRGQDVGPCYEVRFTPTVQVFTLPRKLARQRVLDGRKPFGRAGYRSITAIEPTPSVPVRCIQVDSPDSSYLMGRSYTVTHNSTQIAIGNTAYRIAKNPSLRVAVVCKVEDLATKIVNGIWSVLTSERFRLVFPEVRPLSKNVHKIVVAGWDRVNPTVQAFSYNGSVMGTRIDLLICDDILDEDNTRTEESREAMYNRHQNVFANRLTDEGQELFLSNAWHPRDALHRLRDEHGWVCHRYPVWRPAHEWEISQGLATFVEGNQISSIVGPAGRMMISNWPAQWPVRRIVEKMLSLAAAPVYFRRAYECEAIDDASQKWRPEWIERCEARGRGLEWCWDLAQAHGEVFRYVVTGVDLATKRPAARRKTDDSTFVTAGIYPNGDRRLLSVEDGQFSGPEIVRKVEQLYGRFQSIFWVESNAAQQYIVDFIKQSRLAIPVKSFETHSHNKLDPRFGVESLMAEQEQGRWLIPTIPGQPQPVPYQRLRQEMLGYHPAGHTGDRLMGLWICREGLRAGTQQGEVWQGGSANRR